MEPWETTKNRWIGFLEELDEVLVTRQIDPGTAKDLVEDEPGLELVKDMVGPIGTVPAPDKMDELLLWTRKLIQRLRYSQYQSGIEIVIEPERKEGSVSVWGPENFSEADIESIVRAARGTGPHVVIISNPSEDPDDPGEKRIAAGDIQIVRGMMSITMWELMDNFGEQLRKYEYEKDAEDWDALVEEVGKRWEEEGPGYLYRETLSGFKREFVYLGSPSLTSLTAFGMIDEIITGLQKELDERIEKNLDLAFRIEKEVAKKIGYDVP